MSPEVRRRHALCVEAQSGPLSQPLGQPGHVTVTLQVVGVQAAERTQMRDERDKRTEGGDGDISICQFVLVTTNEMRL